MATIEAIDLSEARAAMTAKRTLTSDNTVAALGGGGGIGGFAAAKFGRLTGDWSSASRSADQDLVVDLRRLRARARILAVNHPLIAKFVRMVHSNVVGKHGVKLAFKVAKQRKNSKGALDQPTNAELLRAWKKWGKKGSCTVCGRYSWRQLQRLMVENVARDGECLLRKVIVPRTVNPFGFQLQIIDADQLDDTYNQLSRADGIQVRMGVEVDQYQRPLAYYIFQGNPYEVSYGSAQRVRVPADQIIHFYIAHRTGQTRGYPLFAPSMWHANMLNGYVEAELTAARISSSLLASIESQTNPDFQGDGINADGSEAIDLGYGKLLTLGPNQTLKNNTPTHPGVAFGNFTQSAGRYIASGCNVAYHKLCNDLAGINYSSGRLGELEERDYWMELQSELIEDVLEPVYESWQRFAQLSGAIDLPFDTERYTGDSLKWEPRRWPWVDPLKDVQANTLLVQNGFETHESVLNSQGRDLQETYSQLKEEQDLADELEIQLGTDIRGQATSEVNDGAPDGDEQPGNSDNAKPGKPAKPSAKPTAAPAKPRARHVVAIDNILE